MAEFSGGHAFHNARDRIVLTTGRNIARHDLSDGQSERIGTVLGKRAYDIALRQYAGEATSRATDQDCTDAMRGEQFRRRCQIGSRFDANDIAAQVTCLGSQDRLHVHGSLPHA